MNALSWSNSKHLRVLILSFIGCGESSISRDLFLGKFVPAAVSLWIIWWRKTRQWYSGLPSIVVALSLVMFPLLQVTPECAQQVDIGGLRSIRMRHKCVNASNVEGDAHPSLHPCTTCRKSFSLLHRDLSRAWLTHRTEESMFNIALFTTFICLEDHCLCYSSITALFTISLCSQLHCTWVISSL